ncbi:hypothetical protein CEP52_000658 [Fusarium oligoseptatum]|uniref:Uncharacterized protein n=1 Tax=Fusarium oligoseptatum TaxID=2604345 RepID=A0A428UMR0_9HYPO|nr:hypothetical protein CEP52_000658 [Fusarium oligoseptatum]
MLVVIFHALGIQDFFCGGFVDAEAATRDRRHHLEKHLRRRDAPPNILLTLYLFAVSSSESTALSTSTISPGQAAISQSNSEGISPSSTSNDPARTTGLVVESGDVSLSSTFNNPDQASVSAFNSEVISLNPTLNPPDQTFATAVNPEDISLSPTLNSLEVEDLGDMSLADLPPSVATTYLPGVNPPTLPSGAFSMGNLSRAATLEAIVTTVVYTILDPHDPAYLTVAEFCTTLKYAPCRNCEHCNISTSR